MKYMLAAALVAFAVQAQAQTSCPLPPQMAFNGPYFDAIWRGDNIKHPVVSAGANITMKGAYDGVTTQTAIIWHRGDVNNTLLPDALLNVGVKPVSWTLLSCGAGYGKGTGMLTCGSSVNVAPTLLGPLAQILKATSNPAAIAAGTFIAGTPSGTGLALGYTWHMEPVQGGTVMPFDRWGSHLDAFIGAVYGF